MSLNWKIQGLKVGFFTGFILGIVITLADLVFMRSILRFGHSYSSGEYLNQVWPGYFLLTSLLILVTIALCLAIFKIKNKVK